MAIIHISEADATRDFAGLLARVRAGTDIVIEKAASPPVLIRVATEPLIRRLSESLRLATEHPSTATLDEGFASDLESIVSSYTEPLQSSWD